VPLTALLKPAEQELLQEERRLLNDLKAALLRFGITDEHIAPLEQSIQQLDDLFLLVVVGEFNAGKSAFINALAGQPLQEEGVTPTTARVTPVRWEDILIVDTPGTNAVVREHEQLTTEYVPRADLVLFVTSADRPFTETERAFLEQIRAWGKKVVFVVNKIDILPGAREREEVRSYVADNARRLLGVAPDVFLVSARAAYRAKHGEPALWNESGFDGLEGYIRTSLDQTSRMQLKFLNPIGVGAAVIDRYSRAVRERLLLLDEDVRLLEDVEQQLAAYRADMTKQFEGRMAAVDNVLLEMERRGHDYFDDTMRIGRVFDLLNRARVQEGFERQVVADAPQQIEKRVSGIVDWLVDADYRQWQRVVRHLAERRRAFRGRIVGDSEDEADARPFHEERRRLVESVGLEAQRVVETYDRRREASALADGARNAVAAAAAAGAGAVGLGAVVTIAATTAAADATGIILASLIAALGFFIIPAKRSRAKAEMRQKIADVRTRLSEALRRQFTAEIAHAGERLQEAIAPYSRFVHVEGDKLRDTEQRLGDLDRQLGALRQRIDALTA
jgi:small GTP-binding protein